MDEDKKISDHTVSLYILHERLSELKGQYQDVKQTQKEQNDRNTEIFTSLIESQSKITVRMATMETNALHLSESVIALKKESSMQTKILSAILIAIVSAVIKILIHGA